jgi:hypothetical protein
VRIIIIVEVFQLRTRANLDRRRAGTFELTNARLLALQLLAEIADTLRLVLAADIVGAERDDVFLGIVDLVMAAISTARSGDAPASIAPKATAPPEPVIAGSCCEQDWHSSL